MVFARARSCLYVLMGLAGLVSSEVRIIPQNPVHDPPSKVSIHISSQMPNEGATVQIQCSATGSPPSEFTVRSNICLVEFSQLWTNTFNIKNVKRTHSGLYWCVGLYEDVENPNSTAVESDEKIHISVRYLDFPKVSTPKLTVREKESATVECAAAGNPRPKITWKRPGGIASDGPTLRISNANTADSGVYSCHAENTQGTKERTTIVVAERKCDIVFEKPVVTEVDSDTYSIDMTCVPSGIAQCVIKIVPPPEFERLDNAEWTEHEGGVTLRHAAVPRIVFPLQFTCVVLDSDNPLHNKTVTADVKTKRKVDSNL